MTAPTSNSPRAGAAPVATNPFLPLNVYVPDGEPHVFGDRVYLIGSHDAEDGTTYCQLDYEFYSAPVSDLTNWTSNGVNYHAAQDPNYGEDRPYLFAPDVVQGNDGRFYLYYCLAGKNGRGGYRGPISVAVADQPDGRYEYLGAVRNPDNSVFEEYVLFDPAVINDQGIIRLYYGACYPFPQSAILRPLTRLIQSRLFGKTVQSIKNHPDGIQGAITIELGSDMLTVQGKPCRVIPEAARGTTFADHPFWEGASIRKIDDTYYLIYSSFHSHELCYATSRHPDSGFVFRGTIISNGDIGLNGRTPEDRVNHTGTNHGSIVQLGGQWFVFYHRNTHGSIHQRQACAEPISIAADGSIAQVPVSSSGLNNAPLPTDRSYPAAICSTLTNGKMPHGATRSARFPRITHDAHHRFVSNVTPGTTIGFTAFTFTGPTTLTLTTRGPGPGEMIIATENSHLGTIPVHPSSLWHDTSAVIAVNGSHDLYLTWAGEDPVEILSLGFATPE